MSDGRHDPIDGSFKLVERDGTERGDYYDMGDTEAARVVFHRDWFRAMAAKVEIFPSRYIMNGYVIDREV